MCINTLDLLKKDSHVLFTPMKFNPPNLLNTFILELVHLHESSITARLSDRENSRYRGLRIWLSNMGVNVRSLLLP